MTAQPTRPIPGRKTRLLAALATTAVAALTVTGTASAAPASGEVVLSLKKGADSSLLREGVKASPRSGGKGGNQLVKLAVSDLDLSNGATASAAALTLKANGRSAKLNDVLVRLGAKSTTISAKLGGKRQVFFRASGAATIDGASARVKGPLALTSKGAKALGTALDLDGITAGKVGSTSVLASATPIVPPAPPKKEEPKVDPYPYASQCPVSAVQGAPPGLGDAPGKVSGIDPAPLFGAGTAQAVTGTEIDWGFKQTFRSYVLVVPPAGSLQVLDGATANPVGSMVAPGSYFGFPTSGGSYEAGSEPDHSDDKLVADGTGTVLFCKAGHGFNIVIKNPTVTIDGENSRITADVGANMNGTWYPFQRVDIADLDLSAVTPEVTNGGNTVVWKDVPATMTADGSTATGDLYPAGEALDTITVKTALERPLTSECTVPSGVATPPVVDFNLTALPTLTSPVTGSGGTINWGFRRGVRNTAVVGGGGFTLIGGATESYPGNMGGAGAPAEPPVGGNGKFFRFPISSYSYEVGTADPGDDRLVATSEASVGFCNPNAGNYGLVIAKPTLVIDGANSRIVANSYSFQAGKGWAGGRIELVDLDTSAIDAVSGSGTVSWGEVLPNGTPLVNGVPVLGAIQTEALSLAGLVPASTATAWDPVAAQITLSTP